MFKQTKPKEKRTTIMERLVKMKGVMSGKDKDKVERVIPEDVPTIRYHHYITVRPRIHRISVRLQMASNRYYEQFVDTLIGVLDETGHHTIREDIPYYELESISKETKEVHVLSNTIGYDDIYGLLKKTTDLVQRDHYNDLKFSDLLNDSPEPTYRKLPPQIEYHVEEITP